MKNNKIYYGGNNNYKQLEVFLSIIIIGYFGIKIVYSSLFNFYPQKYYYRNLNITTNEKDGVNTENITLNAYVPGLWNSELTDFITAIVLCGIVFVFTNVSTKSFVDENGNLSLSFLFGYIIGLGYPAIYNNYMYFFKKEVKYIYLFLLVAFIIFIILLNYNEAGKISSDHKVKYLVYICAVILLFFGLIFSKKNIKSYNSVTYFYNNGQQCTFAKNGVFQSSGDKVNITFPFIAFITLLFFSYEPEEQGMKNLYTFLYGLLLGILISAISYYGIEYFLSKYPEKECKDVNECILKELPPPSEETQAQKNNKNIISEENINPNIRSSFNINGRTKISLLKIISIIIIILICVFLIYNNLKK